MLLKEMKAVTLRSQQIALSQGHVLRFPMMNPFSGFPAVLSYVLVYESTSVPSLTLFLFVESPYFSSF